MPSVPVLGLRRSARALRRAGRRKTSAPRDAGGEKPAPNKSIGNASLLGALADIFCVNFFLAWIGLQVGPEPVIYSNFLSVLTPDIKVMWELCVLKDFYLRWCQQRELSTRNDLKGGDRCSSPNLFALQPKAIFSSTILLSVLVTWTKKWKWPRSLETLISPSIEIEAFLWILASTGLK